MDVYSAIKARYGFEIPEIYRRMEEAGLLNMPPGPADASDERHLWVPEAEWLRPQEILEYEFPEWFRPEFIPFAFTGGGQPWCWWPVQDPEAVVYVPGDEAGVFDAPNLLGSIYRRFLDHALSLDEVEEGRLWYSRWARQLRDDFPPAWIDTMLKIADADVIPWRIHRLTGQGLLDPAARDRLIARDLAFPRLNEEFDQSDGRWNEVGAS